MKAECRVWVRGLLGNQLMSLCVGLNVGGEC